MWSDCDWLCLGLERKIGAEAVSLYVINWKLFAQKVDIHTHLESIPAGIPTAVIELIASCAYSTKFQAVHCFPLVVL